MCVSGQIRHTSQNTELFNFINKAFPDDLFDIKYIGHTWDDQPEPIYKDKFTHIQYERQENVLDWAMDTGYANVIPVRQMWSENKDWISSIKNKDGDKFFDIAKQVIYITWSQVWSGHRAFQYAMKKYKNTADLYIRIRWDSSIEPTVTASALDYHTECYQNIVNGNTLNEGPVYVPTPTLTYPNVNLKLLFNDTYFATKFDQRYLDNKIEDIYNKIVWSRYNVQIPTGHESWAEYFWALGMHIESYFPMVASLHRGNDWKEMKKHNFNFNL